MLFRSVPGTKPEIFDLIGQLNFKGVVIEAFGLGGMHYLRRNLLDGIRKVIQDGIAVLVVTQCRYETSDLLVYEPGRQAISSGILQGFDMTGECAVTKMMWVLGHTKDMRQIRQMMYTNYCGEITIPQDFDQI